MSRIIQLVKQQLNELQSYQEDVKTSWSKVKKPKRSVHVKKLSELCKIMSFQIELIQETIPDLALALQCRDDTIMELGRKLSDLRLAKTQPFFCVDHNIKGPNLARCGEENEWNIARKTVLEKEMAEEMARLSLMPMGDHISKGMLQQVSAEMLQKRKDLNLKEEKEIKRTPGLSGKEDFEVCYCSSGSSYDMYFESDSDDYASSEDAADSVTSGISGRTSVESDNSRRSPEKSTLITSTNPTTTVVNNTNNNSNVTSNVESTKSRQIKSTSTTQRKTIV